MVSYTSSRVITGKGAAKRIKAILEEIKNMIRNRSYGTNKSRLIAALNEKFSFVTKQPYENADSLIVTTAREIAEKMSTLKNRVKEEPVKNYIPPIIVSNSHPLVFCSSTLSVAAIQLSHLSEWEKLNA